MKTQKIYIALPLAIILTAFLMLLYTFDGDQVKTKFATYDDLKQSGYIEKGWLPDFLPESSENIIETHNIDTNTVKAVFEYSISDIQNIEKECIEKTNIENGTEYRCKYKDSYILIKLMKNGEGYLFSSPFKEKTL